MKTEHFVSIVLPVYNGERYLAESIRSCLDQTHRALELIVVDDASTDATPRIVQEAACRDPRIVSVRCEQNGKLPAALNRGFARAKGDLLTWTSDDNLYRPEALATMIDFLNENSTCDFVYADFSVIDEKGELRRAETVSPVEKLLERNVVGPCFLYRRSVWRQVGRFAEDLFLAEDYDYWLRVWASCEMVPLHRDLYLYREHTSSLTRAYMGNRIQRVRDEALARNLPGLAGLSRWEKGRIFLRLAQNAQWRRDATARGKYLAWAAVCSPRMTLEFLWKKIWRKRLTHANRLVR